MSRSRTAERIVLAVTLVGLMSVAYNQRKTRSMVRELDDRVADLDVKVRVLSDAGKLKFTAPPPSAFEAPAATPNRGKRRSAPRAKTPPVPGAQVLDTLYSAADELAQEQDWDAETYDQVARVFEDSTATMLTLYEDLQAGRVNPQDARQQAMSARDDATNRLGDILGPEGFARLREVLKDDMPGKRR